MGVLPNKMLHHAAQRQTEVFAALLAVFLVIFMLGSLVWTPPVQAEDELNCVLCHKFRGLSRIDENGRFRLFYINENLFMKGPHKRIMCMDCHRDIKKIPHDPAKKVTCTVECHLTEPSGKQNFTHAPVKKVLDGSAHSKYDKDGNLKDYPEDYPNCKSCHEQPLYRPLSFFKGGESAGISRRGLSRCKTCHQTGDFAEDFYSHVTSRLQKTRESREIVEVCAKCHADPAFQKRHGLDDVIASYKDTFHGKAVTFGSDETADCLDCHVVYGESVHSIESQSEPTAATHKNNIAATCRNEECHFKAGEGIASYQVHTDYNNAEKNPMQYYMLKFFQGLMAAVLYFFVIIIFLELLRRLFPNFSFIKEKPTDAKSVLQNSSSEKGA